MPMESNLSDSTSKPEASTTKPPSNALNSMAPEEAFALFQENPVGFIETVLGQASRVHLTLMQEQVELQNALYLARRSVPDFAEMEPYILKELEQILQSDEDGVLDPWPDMLERAVKAFQAKLSTVSKQRNLSGSDSNVKSNPFFSEGGGTRKPAELAPKFTRKQIASMSLSEFIENEEAINKALREKKIK
jgi:hypothetical protein